MANEERKAQLYPLFEGLGEEGVRADLAYGGQFVGNNNIDKAIAHEWLALKERERNEKILRDNAAATLKGIHWLAASTIVSALAALAAFATAFITYKDHL